MNIRQVVVFIPFLCFLGCASNDKETPTNENDRPYFDGYTDGMRAKPN